MEIQPTKIQFNRHQLNQGFLNQFQVATEHLVEIGVNDKKDLFNNNNISKINNINKPGKVKEILNNLGPIMITLKEDLIIEVSD